MRYDEETGNMIDDDPNPMSASHQAERCHRQQPGFPSRHEGAHGNSHHWGALALAFALGMSFAQFGGLDKLVSAFEALGDVSENASMEEAVADEVGEPMTHTRLIISCSHCGAQLDATKLQHLESFDCTCPLCGTALHVQQAF